MIKLPYALGSHQKVEAFFILQGTGVTFTCILYKDWARQRALHDRADLESPLPVVILSYKRSGKHIEHLSTPEHKLNKDESPLNLVVK